MSYKKLDRLLDSAQIECDNLATKHLKAKAEIAHLRLLLREWRDPSIDGISREELIRQTDAALAGEK